MPMQVESSLRSIPLDEVEKTSAELERAGVDRICDSEIRRDPLLSMTLAAATTSRPTLATAVTIAFARSPMVVAYAARNLNDYSRGRFRLGIGTQVRRHVEQRFASEWAAPGPKLRDYLLALQAIWRTWQDGEPLSYEGRHYALSLMTPEFDLGPSEHGKVRLDISAVNPYNLELAAELCDGVRLHSFITAEYIRDVVWPRLTAGAAKTGRDLGDFAVLGGGFIATGATEEDVVKAREWARSRVAFYGSTRAYRPVLEHHGWGELQTELRELVRQQRWDELSGRVPDEVLDAFCTAAPHHELGARVAERLGGIVDVIQIPSVRVHDNGWESFASAVGDLAAVPTAARRPTR